MILFADGDPGGVAGGKLAVLLTLASLGGGAVQYLVTVGRDWWREKRAGTEKKEAGIVAHLEALVKRLDDEKAQLNRTIEETQEEIRNTLDTLAKCRITSTQRRAHIRYLEGILTRKRVEFDAYVEENPDETGPHKPLPNHNPNPGAA